MKQINPGDLLQHILFDIFHIAITQSTSLFDKIIVITVNPSTKRLICQDTSSSDKQILK